MAREINKLNARRVATETKPGRYADGGGLYLQVAHNASKSWLFRFSLNNRARQMGLGPINTISLAEARDHARKCRQLLLDGIDPIEHRKRQRSRQIKEADASKTFRECAESYMRDHSESWRNLKHRQQWTSTLETYVYPAIGNVSVADIDIASVKRVLDPIWHVKTETAKRVQERIALILDTATVLGLREGTNPAQWRGVLDQLLPSPNKIKKVKHHAALPFSEIGVFMKDLRQRQAIAALALEFGILTAARTGEVLEASWEEIDLNSGKWTISAERMKAGRDHVVPLSHQCVELLQNINEKRSGSIIFPGTNTNRPMSNMAMAQLLKRMDYTDITVHGFRSTFRDWVAEQTAFPTEVAEMALAHSVGSRVEAAYRRGDMFEKRRKLMQAWADFCDQVIAESTNVVPIQNRTFEK